MTTVSYRTRGPLVSHFCLALASAISVSAAMPLAVTVAAETGAAETGTTSASDTEPAGDARALVDEALRHEIAGEDKQRNESLQAALEHEPEFEPALWHSGYVQFDDRWVRFDDVPLLAAKHRNWIRYKQRRDKSSDSVRGHLKLAAWCGSNGLGQQRRAHLSRVLDLDPNHEGARAALGHRRINGQWVTSERLSEFRDRFSRASEALKRWKPELEDIREQLESDQDSDRKEGVERLMAIDDPAAIPAMEMVLSTADEKLGMLALNALDNMKVHEAAVGLARQAVFSPWPAVRQGAADRLANRPMDTYVPVLLSAMSWPVVSGMEMGRARGGGIAYRHALYREGTDQRRLVIFDGRYRINSSSGPNRRALAGIAGRAGQGDLAANDLLAVNLSRQMEAAQAFVRQFNAMVRARQLSVARENARTSAINEHVASILETATGMSLPATADEWWQWWYDYNEVYVDGEKPLQQSLIRDDVTVNAPAAIGSLNLGDCLAAGTLVWTVSGPMPIEEINVGDRVLSKHPETGRLAYKPVLRRTTRPAGPLVVIKIGRETVRTSGGHAFWGSGKGWVKARDLQPGMPLHGVTGTAELDAVERGEVAETYNLVVADFHTYFVGDAKILSHDNTIRQPINEVVPGLASR